MTDIQLTGQTFATKSLTDADAAQLQALLERCADYFRVALNREPGPAEALAVCYAGPEEGQEPKNKILIAITKAGSRELIGVLDAFRDYPAAGIWYIGLLLFDPKVRGEGIGAEVLEQLALQAAQQGARELQLNVVEQNSRALAFWSRHGFVELRRWQQRYGERESTFIRMSHLL